MPWRNDQKRRAVSNSPPWIPPSPRLDESLRADIVVPAPALCDASELSFPTSPPTYTYINPQQHVPVVIF